MNINTNETTRRRLLQFGAFMAGFYGLLFGTLAVFKDSGPAAAWLLGAAVVAGIYLVRPGWNLIPRQVDAWTWLVFAAIGASAVLAPLGLVLLGIATPYDKLPLSLPALMLPLLAITGIEELLFRQIAYRWLEQGQVRNRTIVWATGLAWACGHLGGALAPGHAMFVLSQSLYLIWIGVLLGELRRRSGSWLLAWFGHMAYNASFLYVFALVR